MSKLLYIIHLGKKTVFGKLRHTPVRYPCASLVDLSLSEMREESPDSVEYRTI